MKAEGEAARWLAAAGDDLAWSRHALAGGFHAPACFHAQQGAEKAAKAVHYARGARTVIGHNVRALIDRLEPAFADLVSLRDAAATLDLYYVPTRYPNGLTEGTPAEAFTEKQARDAIDSAAQILEAAARACAPPA